LDEINGTDEHEKASQNTHKDFIPSAIPQDPESNKIISEHNGQNNRTNNHPNLSKWARFRNWIRDWRASDAAMVLLTLIIAISTTVYTIYARRQWKAMENQLKVMTGQLTVMKTAIEQTGQFAKLDQRAWLGIGKYQVNQFEKGKSTIVEIEIVNSGKTPALNVRKATQYGWSPIKIPGPLQDWMKNMQIVPTISIAPQARPALNVTIYWNKMAPIYDEIMAKTQILYFFGKIDYRTVSDEPGSMTFCIYMDHPESKSLSFCDEYNNVK
jgi:hypothetical protein